MNRLPVLGRLADSIVRRVSGEGGRRRLAQRRFHDALRGRLPRSFQAPDPGPPAPEHLLRTTAGMTEAEVKKWLNPDFYFRTGYEQMREFIHALDAVSFNIRAVGSVFELGCGSGRLLRHLRCIQGIRLVGSDINGECIKWCREHLPGIAFYRNDLEPSLTFLDADSVDLIIASSVFTHIPLAQQRPWLEELYRVMRPGGIFLCTVLGRSYEKAMLSAEDRKRLQKGGHLVLDAQDCKASLATQRAGSCDVFQTRSEVVAVFGSVFQLLDYIDCGAGGQDLLVLLKPR
jgi:SAM-dependent methyltransferase